MSTRGQDLSPPRSPVLTAPRSARTRPTHLHAGAFHPPMWTEKVLLADIRPTQMAVGMRAVEAKRRKIERRAGSSRKMREYLEKRPVPAVLGPGDDFYIIDHHHLSLALWQNEVDEVFVSVVGDLSDMPRRDFLRSMGALGWLHPYDASGRKICPTHLPASLDKLRGDRYRDLAWSVREAGGFEKTAIPFSEFTWANFFRNRISAAMLGRDFERAHVQAMALARSPEARHLPGNLVTMKRFCEA